MNIYIWGDLEFADFVLKGISAMFDGGSHFNYAAAVLLVLFFMWSWIKWSLNPEKTPYPVKEFTFGLVFFLIFGGGTISPKFDVTLISERTGYATTVADVPLLAAVPSWLSTNFFREAAFVIRPFFTVPGYERLNHNDSDVNPLQALVRLSDLSNSILIDANLERTMKEYIATCYEAYLNLDGAPVTNSLDNLVSANLSTSLWDRLQTDITFLDSKKYLASGSVETGDCMNVHAYVKDQLDTAYKEKVEKLLQNNGIRDVDISAATGIITDQLSMGSIAPYTFATNLFVAATIKDGVAQSGMETWANKMVFEASRKRTYEAAGNASMFMRIYIPTITAIEMFSFFIAPVMMILSVMGGIGFSMVGKYLMLVLFINMWGFIKVFVDLYTTLSIKKAFDAVDLATSNPFLFKTYAETFLQVEDWIAVSSNLTNAIPFFAMFLLYGGVHSMMGVMRSVNTGSVDPSNVAPTIATTANNGVVQQGENTYTSMANGRLAHSNNIGTNDYFGSSIASSGVSSITSAALNTFKQEQRSAVTGYNETLNDLHQSLTQAQRTTQNTSTTSSGNSASRTNIDSLIDTESAGLGENRSTQAQILSRLAATFGAQAGLGGSGQSGAVTNSQAEEGMPNTSTSNPNSKSGIKGMLIKAGVSADLAGQLVSGLTDTDVKSFNATFNTAKQKATQLASQDTFSKADADADIRASLKSWQNSDAYTKAWSKAQQISKIDTKAAQFGNQFANDSGLTDTSTLKFHSLSGFDRNSLGSWFNTLDQTEQSRIMGLYSKNGNTPESFNELANQITAHNPALKNNGAYIAQSLLSKLNSDASDASLKDTEKDAGIASKLYRTLGENAPSMQKNAFFVASAQAAERADALKQINKDLSDNGITKDSSVDTSDAAGSNAKLDKASRSGDQLPNVNHSTVKPSEELASDGKPIKVDQPAGAFASRFLTPEQREDIMSKVSNLDLSRVSDFFAGGNKLALDAINSMQDFKDVFSPREQEWGKNSSEWAGTIASAANATGNNSLQLKQGLEDLRNANHFSMMPLIHAANNGDSDALNKLSGMNDALQYLSSKEGVLALSSMSEQEGFRVYENMSRLDKALNSLNDTDKTISRNELDAISQARTSGTITDAQAKALLQLGSNDTGFFEQTKNWLSGGDSAPDNLLSTLFTVSRSDSPESSTLQSIITNSQATVNTNDALFSTRFSDEYIPVSELYKQVSDSSMQNNSDLYSKASNAAAKDIANDAIMVNYSAGSLLIDNGIIQGFNAKFDLNDKNVDKLQELTSGIIDAYDGSSFNRNTLMDTAVREQSTTDVPLLFMGGATYAGAKIYDAVVNNQTSDAQETILTAATNGVNKDIAERLNQVNIGGYGQFIDFTFTQVKEEGLEKGLIVDREELSRKYNNFLNQNKD